MLLNIRIGRPKQTRLTLPVVLVALMALALCVGAMRRLSLLPKAGYPTGSVSRGDVDIHVVAAGELRTTRTVPLSAPAASSDLRLLDITPTGTAVASGEAVMTFDASREASLLAEQIALLREADQEALKVHADSRAQAARDRADQIAARFELESAKLDRNGSTLLSPIEARRNELTLEGAWRRWTQLATDIVEHPNASDAAMRVVVEKRRKATLAVDRLQASMRAMTVRSPASGIFAVHINLDEASDLGTVWPEYKAGDTVSPGSVVAEVLDVAQIEFVARVPEADWMSVKIGQIATLRLASTPERTLEARVTQIAPLPSSRRFDGDVEDQERLTDVSLAFVQPLEFLRPGLTGVARITTGLRANVLYVPRRSVFDRAGQSLVYVKRRSGITQRLVTVVARTETVAVIRDLPEGTEVLLEKPGRDHASAEVP